MLIVRLKFFSSCSANAKKYLEYFLEFLQVMLRVRLKVHKIENFLTPILKFAFFLC